MENKPSPSVALLCAVLLKRDMVCELAECCGEYDGSVVAQNNHFVNIAFFDCRPMKRFEVFSYVR